MDHLSNKDCWTRGNHRVSAAGKGVDDIVEKNAYLAAWSDILVRLDYFMPVQVPKSSEIVPEIVSDWQMKYILIAPIKKSEISWLTYHNLGGVLSFIDLKKCSLYLQLKWTVLTGIVLYSHWKCLCKVNPCIIKKSYRVKPKTLLKQTFNVSLDVWFFNFVWGVHRSHFKRGCFFGSYEKKINFWAWKLFI